MNRLLCNGQVVAVASRMARQFGEQSCVRAIIISGHDYHTDSGLGQELRSEHKAGKAPLAYRSATGWNKARRHCHHDIGNEAQLRRRMDARQGERETANPRDESPERTGILRGRRRNQAIV
jgi:hypothetical protein